MIDPHIVITFSLDRNNDIKNELTYWGPFDSLEDAQRWSSSGTDIPWDLKELTIRLNTPTPQDLLSNQR